MGGYHSGETGGIVPETFRILRTLLDRLDDKETGRVIAELHCEAPQWKLDEAKHLAQLAGPEMYKKYALVEGAQWCSMDNLEQLYLQSTWEPNLSITGMSDIPPIKMAGNAVRPKTSARLSMRLPPSMDHHKAKDIMYKKLTENVPYNAKITIVGDHAGSGFCMKDLPEWLMSTIQSSSNHFYGKAAGSYAIGGSIPFLAELGKNFPETFIIPLGVLGPQSNAHGPNEMINLSYTKKLVCCISHIVGTIG